MHSAASHADQCNMPFTQLQPKRSLIGSHPHLALRTPLLARHPIFRGEAYQSCSICGGLRGGQTLICRDGPKSDLKLSEDRSEDKISASQNGHNGQNGSANGKSKNSASNGKQGDGSDNGQSRNGADYRSERAGQGLIERSEKGISPNGNTSGDGFGRAGGMTMNRNSGPKRPRGTLSPYGDIETAEGSNGDSLRNGRKSKEKGDKAKRQRGSLDIPENLMQVRSNGLCHNGPKVLWISFNLIALYKPSHDILFKLSANLHPIES